MALPCTGSSLLPPTTLLGRTTQRRVPDEWVDGEQRSLGQARPVVRMSTRRTGAAMGTAVAG